MVSKTGLLEEQDRKRPRGNAKEILNQTSFYEL